MTRKQGKLGKNDNNIATKDLKTQPTKVNIDTYNQLFIQISELLAQARKEVVQKINTTMTYTYFQIGKIIVEDEQNGEKRAEYGKEVLKNLSKNLTQKFGKGFSVRNLEQMRNFYIVFSKSLIKSEKSQTLSAKLSWSHYVRLLAFSDQPLKLRFYLTQAETNNWSYRDLNRQISSALFERVALSKDKKGVIAENLEKYHNPEAPEDILKEPLVLEFLGLEESIKYTEKDLETAILNNLQKFLLEFGRGFSFVARQKRLSFEDKNYYADLVFYNRLLKCFVLVDLKIDKLTHADVGQMEMYVNYFDMEEKLNTENPTIGIILCPEKDKAIVKYILSQKNQIFANEYKLVLPNEKELEDLIKESKKLVLD